MKPLLGLDVDGVLNCFGSIWTDEYDAVAWEMPPFSPPNASYMLRVPRGTSGRLATLGERFEIVWCTMWEERAHPAFVGKIGGIGTVCDCAPFEPPIDCECGATGIRPWPVISFRRAVWDGRSTWKLPAVKEYIGDRPFAWIDDDLFADAFEWAHDRATRLGIPTQLVRTNPAVGLADEHVAELLRWADWVDETASESGQRWAR